MNFYKFLLGSVNIGVVFLFFNSIFADNSGVILTVTVADCGNGVVNSGEQCDGSNFGNFNCAGLGFNGGTLSCNASCQYQTSSCISTAYTASTTQIMDFSSGGDFTFTSNSTDVLFDFPANFYTEDLKLLANSYSASSFVSEKPAITGKNFIGQVYDFSFIVPSGTSMNSQVSALSSPVTITMNYSDSDISGFSESAIAPYRWGASDSSWQLISGATVDTANNKVSFSTASFSSFGLFGSPTPSPSPSPSPSQSSSGGGGAVNVPGSASVIFSGRAYPKSSVTLLKDAQIMASTIVGPDSNFQISLTGLSAGSYMFSLYGQDKNGLRSTLFTFSVTLIAGATTNVSGIFIAPTISTDKNEVKRGDEISIFGQTVPQSEVIIIIGPNEKHSAKIKTDNNGAYLYNLNTSPFDFGDYSIKSKVSLSGSISSNFSSIILFKVGAKNILAPKITEKKVLRGDINNEGRVNLIDFSIIAYWYQRSNPPAKVDLNSDGKIDLVDFSIMAYYWTG